LSALIITGASSGLGAALARRYAGPGVTLGLVARRAERLEALRSACVEAGSAVEVLCADVADTATVAPWVESFGDRYGLDLIIANAGVSAGPAPGERREGLDSVARQINTNLLGVINAVEPALPGMIARRGGQIVIVASVAALRGLPYSPGYCASKAGARAYGEALRPLVRPAGIAVTVVCPGFFDSPMTDRWRGPTPFLVSTERAAALVERAVRRKRARLSFPLPLVLGMKIADLLPPALGDLFVRRFRFSISPGS
jgi:NAD(P)-dependent dehydrogenase (short-subunit alcohol dehydrogenase family)